MIGIVVEPLHLGSIRLPDGHPWAADGDLHDPSWRTSAAESLERLRSLSPAAAHFSHDATVWHAH